MKKNTFKSYKEAILERYSLAQLEDLSGILATPTPAQLRDFCSMKCDKDLTKADEELMKAFFETKPDESLKHSISRCNIDKFKPIISFLKREKDTENQIRVGLAAIIIDFNPRPYAKYLGMAKDGKVSRTPLPTNQVFTEKENKPTTTLYKRVLYLILGFISLLSIGYVLKSFIAPEKQCMQWQKDHYEVMECDSKVNSLYATNSIKPIDEKLLDFKKIEVNNKTLFFEKGKAIVWYCKISDTEIDYFNGSGDGYHPVLNKSLRPITKYIIDKYVPK
ncbi:hypothetical protein HKT18_05570 [Flavobacterium sp. IMCC34852]|uniref:Uncharacterized protein n=1 Tax=Flavobacterium rivulicola TaxID=2732161 RepID=A0A7Y3R886_9FLAO|nr:hypothetical protein [Flavobacterium sp. IMCC34852]NNT71682.1 hypothetical protein [Flavobacterium sp. IMCC34852]